MPSDMNAKKAGTEYEQAVARVVDQLTNYSELRDTGRVKFGDSNRGDGASDTFWGERCHVAISRTYGLIRRLPSGRGRAVPPVSRH